MAGRNRRRKNSSCCQLRSGVPGFQTILSAGILGLAIRLGLGDVPGRALREKSGDLQAERTIFTRGPTRLGPRPSGQHWKDISSMQQPPAGVHFRAMMDRRPTAALNAEALAHADRSGRPRGRQHSFATTASKRAGKSPRRMRSSGRPRASNHPLGSHLPALQPQHRCGPNPGAAPTLPLPQPKRPAPRKPQMPPPLPTTAARAVTKPRLTIRVRALPTRSPHKKTMHPPAHSKAFDPASSARER
mmetsp:Transcript_29043/g.81850  ORF Transcript_29043/g.81850 Transcript_29043/m.81850 type:complete len:245 (-) Transcript_29043:1420-2154(-)